MNIDFYELKWRAKQLWLIVKHRPVCKCPLCNGAGGEMTGYYEREWSECQACYRHWDPCVDHDIRWAEGRVPPLAWLRTKIEIWCSLPPGTGIIHSIRCKLGWHDWCKDEIFCGDTCCRWCWKPKDKSEVSR